MVLIACGTSFHASLAGKYFIESLAGIPVDVEYASEYRYRDFILDKDSLVVTMSQSGETAESRCHAGRQGARPDNPCSL